MRRRLRILKGRERVPSGAGFDAAKRRWAGYASDPDAHYDDVVVIDGSAIEPTVTWGVTPAQALGIGERIPDPAAAEGLDQELMSDALRYMQLEADAPIAGTKIDVAFIGSCTNGRLSDFQAVAAVIEGRQGARHRCAPSPYQGPRKSIRLHGH